MSQKIPVNDFQWRNGQSNFDEKLNCGKDSEKACILEVYVKFPKNLHNLPNNLPLLPERMKVNIGLSRSRKFLLS